MPEHVHLLISESGSVSPAKIVQVFKQRVSPRSRARKRARKGQLAFSFSANDGRLRRFWQRRYYDFNVYSSGKLKEKLYYMHANPEIRCARSWCNIRETGRGVVGVTTIGERGHEDGCVGVNFGERVLPGEEKSGPPSANFAKGRPPKRLSALRCATRR
jgi:hypothetical protein